MPKQTVKNHPVSRPEDQPQYPEEQQPIHLYDLPSLLNQLASISVELAVVKAQRDGAEARVAALLKQQQEEKKDAGAMVIAEPCPVEVE